MAKGGGTESTKMSKSGTATRKGKGASNPLKGLTQSDKGGSGGTSSGKSGKKD